MGNYVSHRPSGSTGKVILLDGTIHEYDNPLTVAELMMEHPQQVVVEFQSAMSTECSKKPSPLPADKNLEMDKIYLMLPMRRGKVAPLSSEAARHLLCVANAALSSRSLSSSTTGFLPFVTRVCSAGTKDGQRVVLKRKECPVEREEEATKLEGLDEVLEGRPEYLSRQFSGKGWKPTLDTIKEKVVTKKMSHWLF